MAQVTRTVLVCDKHRGEVEAVGVLEIGIDGQRRKLDLCGQHLAEARQALRPWLRSARSPRPDTERPARRSRTTAGSDRKTSAAVRAWAKENGYELPARGRIPAAVHEAYAAAK